jgi:hypothetical protein
LRPRTGDVTRLSPIEVSTFEWQEDIELVKIAHREE